MPEKGVYDARFFIEYFYSSDAEFLRRLKEDLRSVRERIVSTITIHEVHRINLEKEGSQVAHLRSEIICKDFKLVDVNYEVAVTSANLRSKYRIPMADSIIAATAKIHKCPVVSDDPHFQGIEELKTRWYR